MTLPLVICIGNPARGDDGVSHRVAALLASRDDLDVVTVTQLDVTMAEDLSLRERTVFVDAARRAFPAVSVQRVERGAVAIRSGHALDPAALSSLAERLFEGRCDCWLVGVAAPEMDHELKLSDTAMAASVEAAIAVTRILGVPER